jgi:hypothetical protein
MDLAAITQLFTAIAALGAVLASIHNSRKIQEIHLSINSRMDQLLQETAKAQRAAGAKEERDNPTIIISKKLGPKVESADDK